jgi:hypothetical protein
MNATRALTRISSSVLVALGLVLALSGCSNSSKPTNPATGVSTTTGFTMGIIQKFGTIHLGTPPNEKIFHTEHAVLTRVDDGVMHDSMNDDDVMFRIGMQVEIFHAPDDTLAVAVQYMKNLEGPITAKPSATVGATFDVLGVPVLVDGSTHFDDSMGSSGLTLGGLAVGNVIEVSGMFDGGGILHATFIEGRHSSSSGRTFEIKGLISGLSGTAPNQTFGVNGASFVTNGTSNLHDLVSGLANGQFVEVKTQSTASPFLVTRVEPGTGETEDPRGRVAAATKASVEGIVANLSGTTPNFSFALNGTPVTTSGGTTGVGLVVANAHIEAEGPVVGGVLHAARIAPRP